MTLTGTLTAALLDPLLARDPARPRITYYDDATGERIELSGTTLANWAAKTANLLRDEFDVEPGATVAVLLPAHWQSAAVLLGTWWCGARVLATDLTAPAGAGVVLTDAAHLVAAVASGAPAVAALSLDAFGRGVADLPSGVLDFATEVRLHGDLFAPVPVVAGDALALAELTVDEVLAAARNRATELGLTEADRVMSTLDWTTPDRLVDGLLAVLAAGASLVQCRNVDNAALERKAAGERVTVRLG